MEQGVYLLTVPALGSATATVPGTGWLSVVNGSGDACKNGHTYNLEFGYGWGYAEGRGGLNGFGTGCGTLVVTDVGTGHGDGDACHEEIQF